MKYFKQLPTPISIAIITFGLVLITMASCKRVTGPVYDDTKSTDTNIRLLDDPCLDDETLCVDNVVYSCYSGQWQAWDNCTYNDKTCDLVGEDYRCVAVGSSYGNEDGYFYCDADNVDCYSQCWYCATLGECKDEMRLCEKDDGTGGCADYYHCRQRNCCDGINKCLTGLELRSCMEECRDNSATTPEAISLYYAIEECIACYVCPNSCGKDESQDFPMCGDQPINTDDSPCYASQASRNELDCYSWSSSVGPCTKQAAACTADSKCNTLEICINESWTTGDWESIQKACFKSAGPKAERLYWSSTQCTFCDACDMACPADAYNARCDEYEKK